MAEAANDSAAERGLLARLETQWQVEQFLTRQAEVLDERRWADWMELFTSDGHYWMPADPSQTTGEGVPRMRPSPRPSLRSPGDGHRCLPAPQKSRLHVRSGKGRRASRKDYPCGL